jgi:hypothetical protein
MIKAMEKLNLKPPTINEARAKAGAPPLPPMATISPELKKLVEELLQAAQHAEYPQGDPPVCARAREFLRKAESKPYCACSSPGCDICHPPTKRKPNPCLDPEKMHGYADQFPGTDEGSHLCPKPLPRK